MDSSTTIAPGRRARPTLAVAASKMIEKRIHRLVVVDDRLHVVGLVSAIDLLRAVPGVEDLLSPEFRLEVGSP